MRIACFQHDNLGGLGWISDWMKNHTQFEFKVFRLHEGVPLPSVDDCDGLILMGGAMNPSDDDKASWLKAEKRFIIEFLELEKPILGICFGAQLLSMLLGGNVSLMFAPEKGWRDVRAVPGGHGLFSGKWENFKSFHLHGEQFDIPPGAQRLLSSDLCENQAFLFRQNVLGLQFHPEADSHVIDSYVAHGLIHNDGSSRSEFDLKNSEHLKANQELMTEILNWFSSKH